jgi:predicted metal-dependent hydrolase
LSFDNSLATKIQRKLCTIAHVIRLALLAYGWGKRYLLKVTEANQPPVISIDHRKLFLRVRPGTDTKARAAIMDQWYRGQVKHAAPPLIAKWEPTLAVRVERFFVRRMRTKWGSCNPIKRTIRLNTDLARKPPECLEYIVVHEMVHLLVQRGGSKW